MICWHNYVIRRFHGKELMRKNDLVMEDSMQDTSGRVVKDESKPAPRGSTGRNEQEPSASSAQREDKDRNERNPGDDKDRARFEDKTSLNSLEEKEELEGRTKGTLSYSETDR